MAGSRGGAVPLLFAVRDCAGNLASGLNIKTGSELSPDFPADDFTVRPGKLSV
jgi:hypothetical protein